MTKRNLQNGFIYFIPLLIIAILLGLVILKASTRERSGRLFSTYVLGESVENVPDTE